MGVYRTSRNLESSIIDFLVSMAGQSGGWANLTITKDYKKIYGLPIDANKQNAAIGVQTTISRNTKVEIGDESTWRTAQVIIDVFATSDGQRMDLKDWLIEIIKHGLPFYQYTVSGSTVTSKVQNGNIRILKIDDAPINLNVDKSMLEVVDRYRHRIGLEVTTSQVEV
jgi:hypothetical protein